MESLDYRYHTICISKGTAEYEKDGSVSIIVAHKNPELKNWLNTCDHLEGTMCWRWYRLDKEGTEIQPACEVVKFESLKQL